MARRPTYTTATEIDAPLSSLSAAPFATQDLNAVKIALDGIDRSADGVSKSLSAACFRQCDAEQQGLQQYAGGRCGGIQPDSRAIAERTAVVQLIASEFFGSGGGAGVVAPFADGGIVASPTFFGAGGSVGLMGERGAEAIMPIARGPNGQLGIAAQGAARPTVAAALSRAVARGQRAT